MAAPCRAIEKNPDLVYEYTSKWNTVAVVSDGTRVLGLGDIGPKAGLPVMEGKALLFKWLGGVDAVPIMLDTKDPDEIIRTVLLLQPSFGGINLEDFSQPKCFRILDTLREQARNPDLARRPAGHRLRHRGRADQRAEDRRQAACTRRRVVFIGSGASNVAITRLCFKAGVDPAKCRVVDSQGILHDGREDVFMRRAEYVDKWRLCQMTNAEGRTGGIAEALEGADVCIALSKPGPGTILPEWVRDDGARRHRLCLRQPGARNLAVGGEGGGRRIVATGRSDFPNQVNNSLGFPGIFRGALDVRAKTITDEMCLAAAHALAEAAPDGGMDPDCILPTMVEWEVFAQEAVAVGMKAQEQGLARLTVDEDDLYPPCGRDDPSLAPPDRDDDGNGADRTGAGRPQN